jgi:hypothetical protein
MHENNSPAGDASRSTSRRNGRPRDWRDGNSCGTFTGRRPRESGVGAQV